MAWMLFLQILLGWDGTVTRDELLGRIDPRTHSGFERIDGAYTRKNGLYLRRAAYAAFRQMHRAAADDGVRLEIVSATRPFGHQKLIWERKWARERYDGWQPSEKASDILRYSSMPGTSRHHWGTDIDLNSVEDAYFDTAEGRAVYDWLAENATTYGYHQVYTPKEHGRTGYAEEKWHWSYLPTAGPFLTQYLATVGYDDLNGFHGHETARTLRVIEEYAAGVGSPGRLHGNAASSEIARNRPRVSPGGALVRVSD